MPGGLIVSMQVNERLSLEQIQAFLEGSEEVAFEGRNRQDVYRPLRSRRQAHSSMRICLTPTRLRHANLETRMPVSRVLRNSLWVVALCLCAQEQQPASPPFNPNDVPRMPPRGGPNDYQAHARVGAVTIGAEFMRHAVPTPQGEFSTEDYVVVETGLFGAAGQRARLSVEDFSLRINGKKALPSLPFGMVLSNLKDPNWLPPEPPKPKASSLSTGNEGAGSNPGDPPPPPPKMPLPLVHAMQVKVEKAALPEGDRGLPEAGLLFFAYHGVSDKIKSVELIYSGPAGKATLTLQP